ncbi:YkyB family protein [Lederbergia panacisoli]|uniref:YkyB family protein n=1 Tax=Lederbergia panacisoli TaxID=1255251 RepID=UPI00214CA727|nr:YkyB family protein [Lederbergia panacisoli]MCR2820903.1 YkyB family protein [Lederbergia panacisoli]
MDKPTNNFLEPTIPNLSQAIFTVNRHAKTAINPKFLYTLKKNALNKMIQEKKATKIGLHFSRNPKFSQQQSDVLVKCGDYSFHIPPTKEDFEHLPHLGHLDQHSRNPKTRMSLNLAKQLLINYTGLKENQKNNQTISERPVFKKLGDSFF